MTDADTPHSALVATNGWRPLSLYPADTYVYVTAHIYLTPDSPIYVARRAGKPWSTWKRPPPAGELGGDMKAWKPIPTDDGISVYERQEWLYGYPNAWTRAPEQVYPPGGCYAKLTPEPAGLLRAMFDGGALKERAFRWTEWRLHVQGLPPRKYTERPINALCKLAFIARAGVLPPGRFDRWTEYDWFITEAGHMWLAVNGPMVETAIHTK